MKAALALFIYSFSAWATTKAPQKATLDLEWEVVQEASGYEVELVPKEGGAPLRFTAIEPQISKSVPIGVYRLRVRSKEASSGVYGEWSEPSEIEVTAKPIELVSPPADSALDSENGPSLTVEFKWNPAAAAKTYTLRVWPVEEPQKAKEFKTQKTSLRVKLAGMKEYRWHVTFETTKSVNYAADPSARSFIVKGPKLTTPSLEDIELPFVTHFNWAPSPGADKYEAVLMRHDLDVVQWEELMSKPDTKETTWEFERLKPGVYRIEVTAHARFRTSSETDFIEFMVKPTRQELLMALGNAIGNAPERAPAVKEKKK